MMFEEIFDRHQRIAFQFSGGKDSTAALFLLRPYWGRMTVYWLDSGDSFPETRGIIEAVVDLGIVNFVKINGLVNEVVARYGPPSDIVPFGSSEAAYEFGVAQSPRIQDRFLCCARSKIAPMHQRMIDDGITILIRGQKDCDTFKGPFKSGDCADGFEFLYPIEKWSDEQVFSYLGEAFPQACELYKSLNKSGDCMRCSAWHGDHRGEYLAQHHPVEFHDYRERMRLIASVCAPVIGVVFGSIAESFGERQ